MPAPHRPDSSGGPERAALPDYWSFVEAAQRRISAEFPETDLTANLLFILLNGASSTVVYDFDSSIHRPRGGTWSSSRLMFTLWVTGPLASHEVAALAGMSRSAVSSLTKTLEGKGLVRREASPHDGRSWILHLTETGADWIRTTLIAQNERESQWAGVLTEEEQQNLVELLGKLMAQRKAIGARRRK
ncbi:MarR family winged helix-turn-helix transcriptional regulator [Kocuria sp. M4R2S49]|uniref:MarR family winged helix-turn-helix transcriptional regulator n=1 Tax=Kocuria rhizosphaericola TaxID=3376284 RepID=UPI0037AC2561